MESLEGRFHSGMDGQGIEALMVGGLGSKAEQNPAQTMP